MRIVRTKGIICLMLVCFLTCFSSIALANDNGDLQWETTDVHFRHGNLVVEGYFQNNGDSTIRRINSFRLKVFLKNGDDSNWAEYKSGKFYDIYAHLRPGETVRHRFVIENVDRVHFDQYSVRWHAQYHGHHSSHSSWSE